jgi:hypothetical protein
VTHQHEAISKLTGRLAYEVTGVGACTADARTVLGRHFHVNRQPQRRLGYDRISEKRQAEERSLILYHPTCSRVYSKTFSPEV